MEGISCRCKSYNIYVLVLYVEVYSLMGSSLSEQSEIYIYFFLVIAEFNKQTYTIAYSLSYYEDFEDTFRDNPALNLFAASIGKYKNATQKA